MRNLVKGWEIHLSKLNSGIYYIQNKVTKQLYVGLSDNLTRREYQHLRALRTNNHVNKHLQNSFNKYGEENFQFGIIERCEVDKLSDFETAYINMFNLKKYGFNIVDGGYHVFPDNRNENHGMWRQDISNDKIKELYLGDYNSKQIAEMFDCSPRTINRRLRKIFGDEYDVLKEQKRKAGLKKVDTRNPNIRDEYILKLANEGYNSVEISSKIGCSDRTVMGRLKQVYTSEEYNQYKQKNTNRKLKAMRQLAHTPEGIAKATQKRKKYSLWDGSNIHYYKNRTKNENFIFYCRYKSHDLKIGPFREFVSPQIIHDLIVDFAGE